ncbi:ABC transporter substrate-binding protein [Actinophytocola sp.]|uniref:ABC transporter substrate-binding protein n=1 Tax=Actinophytocola sp. TaxID=1872138 RepID=UPI002ED10A68
MKPVVRIATGVDPSFTPVYVAAEKGFFDKHGVTVEYITTEGGPTMTQAVIAGEAQMATQSDATTVTLMASNAGLRALSVFEQSSTYIKVVYGKDVKTPKKVGVVPGLMALATDRYLKSKNIDGVEKVTATPPDIPTLLERGDIDAAVIYEPWASRAAEQSGGSIVGDIGDFGLSYAQWLVADEKWLSQNEKAAAGVVAAIEEAGAYATKNPDEAAQITEKAIKIPKDQALDITSELEFVTRDFTDADLDQAKAAATFFVDSGAIKSAPDVGKQVLKGWYTEHVKS